MTTRKMTAEKMQEHQANIDDIRTYTLMVKFERNLEDDKECVKDRLKGNRAVFGKAKTWDEKLVAQLVDELQHAYDCSDCAIAGAFQVMSKPKLKDTITIADRKGPFKK